MDKYKLLEKSFNRISALVHATEILDWDESVMMPSHSGQARASAQSELKVIKHEILTDPKLFECVQNLDSNPLSLNNWELANFREMKRQIIRARAVKKDLVESLSLASSECQQAWRSLRQENNWIDFLPLFDKLIALLREEASQRSESLGLDEYDCLLDAYSPGMTSQKISEIFDQVKLFLPPLIKKIIDHQKSNYVLDKIPPSTIENQKNLGVAIMKALGFDFNHGRLDTSLHPFCGGVPRDVRITTRYNESDFTEGLMGIIHETGHALYEQSLPEKWLQQPVGFARGMDIHESQSLFFENIIGRNQHFFKFILPLIQSHLFKDYNLNPSETQGLYNKLNQVKKTLIRVNADEATYPLHIILRYEIEKDLILGKLSAKDLPEVWDFKMKSYLDLSTKNDFKNGCMQDIHWPSGAFGYFPSYSLGAMFATQCFHSILEVDPKFNENLSLGNLSKIKEWLDKNIWSKGSLFNSNELIYNSTNEILNPHYFKKYLTEKYLI